MRQSAIRGVRKYFSHRGANYNCLFSTIALSLLISYHGKNTNTSEKETKMSCNFFQRISVSRNTVKLVDSNLKRTENLFQLSGV